LDVARLINQGSCSDKILKQHKRTRKSFKKGNCGLVNKKNRLCNPMLTLSLKFNQQNKDNNSCTRVSDFNNFQQPAPAPTFVDLTYQAVCNILGVDQFKYGEENFFNILDKEDPYSPNAFDDEEEAKKILEKNDEILDDEIEKAFVDLGV
ncbi:hypothetical protein HK099_000964, partial [Clydaea vesicula]